MNAGWVAAALITALVNGRRSRAPCIRTVRAPAPGAARALGSSPRGVRTARPRQPSTSRRPARVGPDFCELVLGRLRRAAVQARAGVARQEMATDGAGLRLCHGGSDPSWVTCWPCRRLDITQLRGTAGRLPRLRLGGRATTSTTRRAMRAGDNKLGRSGAHDEDRRRVRVLPRWDPGCRL